MIENLPSGTVTFLFTDIEGSTQLWERYPESMKAALARHDGLLREAVETHHGRIIKMTGDGGYAAFAAASQGVEAAVTFQRAMTREKWAELEPDRLRARAGLHTGEAEQRDGDYHGPTLNRASRLMSIGHGGQILLSATTAHLISEHLPADLALHSLGWHRLKGLNRDEEIFQAKSEGLLDNFPPLSSLAIRVHHLPTEMTEFVGRESEVTEIVALLASPECRLLTLLGPGGIGKTRLAIRSATAMAEDNPRRYSDGIHFVPLSPRSTPDQLVTAVADAMGLVFDSGESDPKRRLVDFLRRRELLLVLDNMEQLVIAGGPAVVSAVLDAAPAVQVLTTSRARLGVFGERLFPVQGLAVPESAADVQQEDGEVTPSSYGSLQLFVQAARRVSPAFRLTAENLHPVVRICRGVYGMPLAIELAAAWLVALSPDEIAAELERDLELLATDLEGIPAQQRSIRVVFETTWTLSNERERTLLKQLSLFRGGFDREAAEAIAGATLRELLSLVNKSWLERSTTGVNGRFAIHELLRQYAAEKLADDTDLAEKARKQFTDYYAALLGRALPKLRASEQLRARDELTPDLENILDAWDHLVRQGDFLTVARRMALPLHFYSQLRGGQRVIGAKFQHAAELLLPGVVTPDDQFAYCALACAYACEQNEHRSYELDPTPDTWPMVHAMADPFRVLGYWYVRLCKFGHFSKQRARGIDRLRRIIDEGHPHSPEWLLSDARDNLGHLLYYTAATQTTVDEAVLHFQKAAEEYERLGDRFHLAGSYTHLSRSYTQKGEYEQATALLERAEALLAALGQPRAFDDQLAEIRGKQGRIDLMFALFRDAQEALREQGDIASLLHMLSRESINALQFSTIAHARQKRETVVALEIEYYGQDNPWNGLELGEIARVEGNLPEAEVQVRRSVERFRRGDFVHGLAFCERALGDIALARGDVGPAADHFRRALDHNPVDVSWWIGTRALSRLALAETAAGRPVAAFGRLLEAIPYIVVNHEIGLGLIALLSLGHLALASGRSRLALGLSNLIERHPLGWNETKAEARQLRERAIRMSGASLVVPSQTESTYPGTASALLDRLVLLPPAEVDEWLRAAEAAFDELSSLQSGNPMRET